MSRGSIGRRATWGLAIGLAWACLPAIVQAQNTAGVFVDAEGVLHKQIFDDPSGRLTDERVRAALDSLSTQVASQSPYRKISLNRLELAIQAQLAQGRELTNEMRRLAGLTRVQFVFYYPDSQDIVIAGPAEGWAEDLSGRVRGLKTGQPVILLEDLVVALRAFPPGQAGTKLIGCSIDPTPEGLSQMQQFLANVGSQLSSPSQTPFIVEGLKQSMGLQNITVHGVPVNTHFAQVLVEADYRMKLIGIGLERPAIKLASYVDRADPALVSRNAMQRWFFMPDYECVRVTDDELGMELVGDGVKLVGEDELVSSDGNRRQVGATNKASQGFVSAFTKGYPQLAQKTPVYAQLRNLIDLSVAAAFIQKQDLYAKAGWEMKTLLSEEAIPVEVHQAPTQVETVVAAVYKGNRLMTPLGGGVEIRPAKALDSANLLADEEGKLNQARQELKIELADGQWWWD